MLELMNFSLKRNDRDGKQSLEANRSKVSVVRESGAGCLKVDELSKNELALKQADHIRPLIGRRWT